MGFLSGKVSFVRFKVNGPAPKKFEEYHLDRLTEWSFGRRMIASADGFETGWIAGDGIDDKDFIDEKNIASDALLFEMRIDVERLPRDLMYSYYKSELKGLTKGNSPSSRQKRDAKDSARDRLADEAKDGRFKKRKVIPVMWDRLTNEVLFGSPGEADSDRLFIHFERTFQLKLEPLNAGKQAFDLAEARQQTRQVDDSAPSAFLPGKTPTEFAWIMNDSSRDFLGNEFLLWLWYYSDMESDTVKVADDSEITFMIRNSLVLDCPRGETGHASLTHEGPSRMREARAASKDGKMPRSFGLTMVRNDQQYELNSIAAETLAIGTAKLPALPNGIAGQARSGARVQQVRDMLETLNLLYDEFGRRRFGKQWEKDLGEMQKWLKRDSVKPDKRIPATAMG